MYFGCFCFQGELGFLNCDDICICMVNKQFDLLKFVLDSIYVDPQYPVWWVRAVVARNVMRVLLSVWDFLK